MEPDIKQEGLKRQWYCWWNPKSGSGIHIYFGKPYDEYCLNFDFPWFGFGYAY